MNRIQENIGRLSRHTMVYGLGNILNRAITFLLLPLYTNVMSTAEYGVLNLIYPFLGLMNVAFLYGMDAAFMRFFIPEKDPEKRKAVFSTVYVSIVVTTITWTLLLFVFRSPLTDLLLNDDPAGNVFWLAFIILALDGLSFIPVLYYRSIQNAPRYVVIIFLEVTLNLSLNVLFVGFWHWGVKGVLLANIISSSFKLLLSLPAVLRNVDWSFSRGLWRALLSFGLPTVPAVLFVMVINLGDRFILEYFFNKEVVGIYSAGYKIGMIMALLVTAFRFAWHPFFLSIADQEDAPRTYARIMTLFVALMGFVFLLVALLAPAVLTLDINGKSIIPPDYAPGLKILPYILLAHIFQGIYVNLVVGMYIKKRTSLAPLFTGTGMVINLGTNFLLLGVFGWDFTAAGLAALLAYVFQTALLYVLSRRFYPVPYELGRLARTGIVILLLYLSPQVLLMDRLWISLFAVLAYFPLLMLTKVLSLSGARELAVRMASRGR